MLRTLTVTEAARSFSDLINRVYYQGYNYLLTRNGTVVATLHSTAKPFTGADLARWWENHARLDPADAEAWAVELAELKSSIQPPQERTWAS
jgi:antitoxin (DNA-binding transcriptional repressor) of toxin-antitoxin stability system